jgi:hypothetical protein
MLCQLSDVPVLHRAESLRTSVMLFSPAHWGDLALNWRILREKSSEKRRNPDLDQGYGG